MRHMSKTSSQNRAHINSSNLPGQVLSVESTRSDANRRQVGNVAGTTSVDRSSGDRALLALTNLVCSALGIDSRSLAALFISLIDTLQDLCRLRSSPCLLPCVAQGHVLHILSILAAAGYAGESLNLPFKVMECVAAALSLSLIHI